MKKTIYLSFLVISILTTVLVPNSLYAQRGGRGGGFPRGGFGGGIGWGGRSSFSVGVGVNRGSF